MEEKQRGDVTQPAQGTGSKRIAAVNIEGMASHAPDNACEDAYDQVLHS